MKEEKEINPVLKPLGILIIVCMCVALALAIYYGIIAQIPSNFLGDTGCNAVKWVDCF